MVDFFQDALPKADVVTMAKGLAGGMPLAAIVGRADVLMLGEPAKKLIGTIGKDTPADPAAFDRLKAEEKAARNAGLARSKDPSAARTTTGSGNASKASKPCAARSTICSLAEMAFASGRGTNRLSTNTPGRRSCLP